MVIDAPRRRQVAVTNFNYFLTKINASVIISKDKGTHSIQEHHDRLFQRVVKFGIDKRSDVIYVCNIFMRMSSADFVISTVNYQTTFGSVSVKGLKTE